MSEQRFFTTWLLLVVTRQQGSDMGGHTHTQAIGCPLQRHPGLAPQTRDDSNLLRGTLAAALEVLREGVHLPVGLLTGFGQRIQEFHLLNVTNRRQPCQTGIRPV